MSSEFITSLVYLNGKIDPHQEYLVMFIVPVRSAFLVWFYIIMDFAHGTDLTATVYLLVATHFFYYLKEIVPRLPQAKHIIHLRTPQLFRSFSKYMGLDEKPFEFPRFDDAEFV